MFTTSIEVQNDPAEIGRVQRLMERLGCDLGLEAGVTFVFKLALEEVLTNIMRCAYSDDAPHLIEVHVRAGAGQMEVAVHDDGVAFDPLSRAAVDTTLDVESREIGGLGIHLVRTMMDEVEYRRSGGRNVLTMRKATE